jgi:hypothetical protein
VGVFAHLSWKAACSRSETTVDADLLGDTMTTTATTTVGRDDRDLSTRASSALPAGDAEPSAAA